MVEVKDGYGRNYLVPRGFAMKWTRGAEKQIDSIQKARSAREIAGVEQAQEVRGTLESLKVQLHTRAGESGRLFGAVTAADIVSAVKSSGGPDIDKRRVELGNPIKAVGDHQVSVRLHPEVSATIRLEVVGS